MDTLLDQQLQDHNVALEQLGKIQATLEQHAETGINAEEAGYLQIAVQNALEPIGMSYSLECSFESFEGTRRVKSTNVTMEAINDLMVEVTAKIEDLQKKAESVVSQEGLGLLALAGGIIAALHYFLEVRPARKKKEEIVKYAVKANEGKGEVEAWKLVSELHKLIDNKKSFEALPLKTGKVEGKWISSNLAGSKTNVKDVIQRVEKHVAIVKKVVDSTNANIAKNVKTLTELGLKIEKLAADKNIGLDAATDEVMKTHQQDLVWPAHMSTSDVSQLIGQHCVTVFDGSKVNIDEDAGVDSVDQLDALTHVQIESIVKALESIYFKVEGIPPLDTPELYGPYEGKRAPMKHVVDRAAKDAGGPDDISNLVVRKSIDYTWGYAISSAEYAIEEAIEALGRWIVHSINWTPELKKSLGLDK